MRKELKDYDFSSPLAMNDRYVILGNIGGRRAGEISSLYRTIYDPIKNRPGAGFIDPKFLRSEETDPEGVTFTQHEVNGVTVTAGYDKENRKWYVRR